jgi:hypothetical protein
MDLGPYFFAINSFKAALIKVRKVQVRTGV